MKMRTVILAAIAASLLLGTMALAQSGGHDPFTWHTIKQGIASGGTYYLTSLPLRYTQGDTWQVHGTASGGEYRLLGPTSATLQGNGCCCIYLPCVLRRSP